MRFPKNPTTHPEIHPGIPHPIIWRSHACDGEACNFSQERPRAHQCQLLNTHFKLTMLSDCAIKLQTHRKRMGNMLPCCEIPMMLRCQYVCMSLDTTNLFQHRTTVISVIPSITRMMTCHVASLQPMLRHACLSSRTNIPTSRSPCSAGQMPSHDFPSLDLVR